MQEAPHGTDRRAESLRRMMAVMPPSSAMPRGRLVPLSEDRWIANQEAVHDEAFFAGAREVLSHGRLAEEACYIQHGRTTTLLHSIAVAFTADMLARLLDRADHVDELRRAALLHDYYLYDWHIPDRSHRLHGLRHPGVAARNALRDFPDLTEREADAIRRHMFPLSPIPPRHSTGWLVTFADKHCAFYETFARSGAIYPNLRAKCARYLPELELGPIIPSAVATVPGLDPSEDRGVLEDACGSASGHGGACGGGRA